MLDVMVFSPSHLLNVGDTRCEVAYTNVLVHRFVLCIKLSCTNCLLAPLEKMIEEELEAHVQ